MQLSSLFRRRYTEPGAPPDALNPPSVFVEPKLHRIEYTAADVREDDPARFDDLDDPEAGATAWIDCQGLGDGAVARACGVRFGFHELAIADAVKALETGAGALTVEINDINRDAYAKYIA